MDEYSGITPHQSIQEHCESAGWDALTNAERELLCLYDCVSLIYSGSMRAFLTRCDPNHRALAVRGFLRVGATGGTDVVRRALELFPDDAPPPEAESLDSPLRRLTQEFFRVDARGNQPPGSRVFDGERASNLADAYANAHPTEFHGPRTLSAWRQSRFARRVIEPPWRIEALEQEAASDAQFTKQVCPTCGQPMPTYRQTCKRCGRPHRPSPPPQ